MIWSAMIDPKNTALFIPPGLQDFKLALFERIGLKIHRAGGLIVRHDYQILGQLPAEIIPIVGCSPQLQPLYADWRARKRDFIYWDRGYLRRVFATWLPRGANGGYYRWHVNSFQMERIQDVPPDRWRLLNLDGQLLPWRKGGRKVVIADTLPDYWNVRGLPVDWSHKMAAELRTKTDRPIVVRHKESKLPLNEEIKDAHCLVAHGSIAAVESVVMGCPVFVDQESAAACVGVVGFDDLEHPVYPERQAWLNSLAYHQFNENELVDGTLWRLIQ
jgi:hypothetical protein